MKRSEIDNKYKWHLNDLVANADEFEQTFKFVMDKAAELSSYSGKLGDRDSLLACFRLASEVGEKAERLYVYAHEFSHEDLSNSEAVALSNRTEMLLAMLMTAMSFVNSELSALPESVIDGYIADPEFSDRLHRSEL